MKLIDILYAAFIIGVGALLVWVGFDIHHRLVFAHIPMACVLILRVFWKRAKL